jgi:hypothetical protein
MALKDWKKEKGDTEWLHKNIWDYMVLVELWDGKYKVFIDERPLTTFTFTGKMKEKTFETKLQALKFAKEYMRKH